jgi:hypothetical protein
MRIAVCFSGMIRTGIEAFPSIKRFVGDLWDNCDFFMHTWDLDYHNVLTGEPPEHFDAFNKNNLQLKELKVQRLSTLYNFKAVEIEPYHKTIGDLSGMFSNYIEDDRWLIPWFYSWHKSIILKKKFEAKNKFSFDAVVKLRPDVIFNKEITLQKLIDRVSDNDFGINMIYNDSGTMITDDIVFVNKGTVSDKISDWWIHRLITKEYLETASPFAQFYTFIKSKGINPIDLNVYYLGNDYRLGLLRQECTVFNPIYDFDKCVECDRLHYHVIEQDQLKHVSFTDIDNMKRETLKTRGILPKNLE